MNGIYLKRKGSEIFCCKSHLVSVDIGISPQGVYQQAMYTSLEAATHGFDMLINDAAKDVFHCLIAMMFGLC